MGIFRERTRGCSITREASLDPCCSTSVTEEASKYGCIFFFFLAVLFQLWYPGSLVWCELLAVACGIQFPIQGSKLDPLHWQHRVPGTGPPGKSQFEYLWCLYIRSFGRGEGDYKTSFLSFCPTSLVPFSSVWSFLGLSPKPTSTLETKSALFITQGVQAKRPTGENVRHGSGRGWSGDVTPGFREKWTSFWDIL